MFTLPTSAAGYHIMNGCRIQATIDAVAAASAEMADMQEQMEEESRKEAEKRCLPSTAAPPVTASYSNISAASAVDSFKPLETGQPYIKYTSL